VVGCTAIEGSIMKKHHLFAFYCTLLVPVGALAGLGLGQVVGGSAVLVIIGAVLGFAAAYLLQRRAAPDETP
jgi:uncharacterized membrane protein YdjX (TVP38/TMEM64 family)